MQSRLVTLAADFCVCAGHGARLPGWKSPDQVYVEPTCLRAARRQANRNRIGGVWYARGELARDSKALPPRWGVLYQSPVYARNVLGLTLGDLPVVSRSGLRAGRPALTGRAEVSRGHSRGETCVGAKASESPAGCDPACSRNRRMRDPLVRWFDRESP